MRRAGLVQLATGLLLTSRLSQAEPLPSSPYELSYQAPAGCPDQATFRADVVKHVHDTSRAAGARLALTIEKQADGFRGTLIASDSSGAQGARRIDAKTCGEVAQALAFFAGLVIELGGRVDDAEPPPPAAPAPPPTAKPAPPPAAPMPRVNARSAAPFELSALALVGARGAFAPVPRMTGEAGAELSTRAALWAPSLRLLAFVGSSGLASEAGSATLRFGGARLELCPLRFGSAALALRPCLGSELGVVLGRGQIAELPRSTTTPWASVELTLRLQWFLSRGLFAELGGGPVLPVVRTHYYFSPDRTLYSVPALSARAAFGLGLVFR